MAGKMNLPCLLSKILSNLIAYLEGMDDLNIRIFKKSTSFVDCDDGDLECVACPIFVTAIPRGF